MKHHTLKWAGVISILAFLAVSCGGNGAPPPGIDRSGLGAAIGAAQAMLDGTYVSANGTDVPAGSYWTSGTDRGILQSAIDSARSVYNNTAATQAAINAAATIMRDATVDFEPRPGTYDGTVNRAGLNTAIFDAQRLLAGTQEADDGTRLPPSVYWATPDVRAAFQAAITAATNAGAAATTQVQVTNALAALATAQNTFDNLRRPGTLDPHGGFLGQTAHLSGRVYEINWTAAGQPSFAPSTVNATVTSWAFSSNTVGTITGGFLDVTLGTPTSLSNIEVQGLIEDLERDHANVTVSNPAAQIAFLSLDTSDPDGWLYREYFSGTLTNYTVNWVRFIYVSADVRITGTGRPNTHTCQCGSTYWGPDDEPVFTPNCDCEEWFGFCPCDGMIVRTADFDITLSRGWNALHTVETAIVAAAGSTINVALHHRNPGPPVRWVFEQDDWDGYSATIEPAMQELPGRASPWLGGRR